MRVKKYNTFFIHLFPFLLLFFRTLSLCAQQESEGVFYGEMGSNDLLQLTVEASSFEDEKLFESSAVVTRFDASILINMGINTLEGILNVIPGTLVNETHSGSRAIMIRGLVDGDNQKVLFLLNGVPYWMSFHADVPIKGIPFETISHVEVIRGPGSVQFGTNASAGVINIVTKNNSEKLIKATIAEKDFQQLNLFWGDRIYDWKINIGAEFSNEGGYDNLYIGTPIPPTFPSISQTDGIISKESRISSGFLHISKKNFNFFVHHFKEDLSAISNATILSPSEVEINGSLAHIDLTLIFNQIEISMYSDYNLFYKHTIATNLISLPKGYFRFSDNGKKNYRWRNGINGKWFPSDNIKVITGIDYEIRSTGDYNVINSFNNKKFLKLFDSNSIYEYGIYSQTEYQKGDFNFLVGARSIKNEAVGSDVTPRASIKYLLSKKHTIKLIHASGYNSPVFRQTISPLGVKIEGLEPERVSTTDLVYSYHTPRTLTEINLFYTEAKDLLINDFGQFKNIGKFNRYGFECSTQLNIGVLNGFASISYIKQGNNVDNQDPEAVFAPRWLANLGLSYKLNFKNNIGLVSKFISKRNNVNSVLLVNFNYDYYLNRNVKFSLRLDNVFDDDLLVPDLQSNISSFALQSGKQRSLSLGTTFLF